MSKVNKAGLATVTNTKELEAFKAEQARINALPQAARELEALKAYKAGQQAHDKAKQAMDKASGSTWTKAILYAVSGVAFATLESMDATLIKLNAYRSAKSIINGARDEGVPLLTPEGMPMGKEVLRLLTKGKENGLDLSGKTVSQMQADLKAVDGGDSDEGETPKTREATPEEIIRSAFLHMEQEPEKYLFPIKAKIARLVAMIDANTASKRKAAKGTAPAKCATVPDVGALGDALNAAMAGAAKVEQAQGATA
jgi:hypothetical protein